jgi:transposase InsO family protein
MTAFCVPTCFDAFIAFRSFQPKKAGRDDSTQARDHPAHALMFLIQRKSQVWSQDIEQVFGWVMQTAPLFACRRVAWIIDQVSDGIMNGTEPVGLSITGVFAFRSLCSFADGKGVPGHSLGDRQTWDSLCATGLPPWERCEFA